jgi:hypothetical protein
LGRERWSRRSLFQKSRTPICLLAERAQAEVVQADMLLLEVVVVSQPLPESKRKKRI